MSEEARQLWEKICNVGRRFHESRWYPRKLRVLVNSTCIALFVVALYVILGGPRLSVKGDFRAIERANLVGPGKILGIEAGDFSYYDHLLIAEDQEGVILYAYDSKVWYRNEQLSYREKTGDIMVLAGPSYAGSLNRHWDFEVPIVLFGTPAKVTHAQVEIVTGGQNNYIVECVRTNQGYLYGIISYKGRETGQWEVDLLQKLSDLSSSQSCSMDMTVIPIHVRMYDEEDRLVGEETVELYSVAYESHKREMEEGE